MDWHAGGAGYSGTRPLPPVACVRIWRVCAGDRSLNDRQGAAGWRTSHSVPVSVTTHLDLWDATVGITLSCALQSIGRSELRLNLTHMEEFFRPSFRCQFHGLATAAELWHPAERPRSWGTEFCATRAPVLRGTVAGCGVRERHILERTGRDTPVVTKGLYEQETWDGSNTSAQAWLAATTDRAAPFRLRG